MLLKLLYVRATDVVKYECCAAQRYKQMVENKWSFMGFTQHFNLHFRVNSLFHHLCSQCYAAQHSYVPLLSLRRDSPPKSSPTFSVRPRSSVGRVTVDLIRRSWVRFPPRSKDFFFTSCGSLIPFTRANAQWVIHGFNQHLNLHFRVNSLFHHLCSQCDAAQHSYVPLLSLRRDRARKPLIQTNSCIAVLSVYVRLQNETKASVDFQT